MAPIFGVVILSVVFLFAAIFIGLYSYFTRNFNFWQKLGVPYVKPTPFVGNLKECVFLKTTMGQQLQRLYVENSDKPYVGIFSFDKPSLLICDLELVKNILVKDWQNFMDHILTVNTKLDPVFGRNLFVLKGKRWQQFRANLSPVFTPGKMKMMFPLVDICGKELADYVDKITAEGSPVEIRETMYKYTTDSIASCAFGVNSNSLKDPDAEFRSYLRGTVGGSVRVSLAFLAGFCAPYLSYLLKLQIVTDSTADYIRKIVWSTVEYREKHGITRKDFLDCMIELRKRGKEEALCTKKADDDTTFQIDDDDFVAQAFTFLAAGFESSGSTLSFALYELALHPEIQQRLREEILQVLSKHDGKVTHDGIQDMPYLDMVVSETLRKYPVIPVIERMCCRDYKLPSPSGNGTITLPAGIGVYISAFGFHHDPKYFPEPRKFDPERFTEENKQRRPNYTYIPFGEGPRVCLGMRFGLMQVKTGLCHMLSRFEVAPCKDTPVTATFDRTSFVLGMEKEFLLSFKRANI